MVIGNGTYRGDGNMINHSHRPPNGTAENFTRIAAENIGQAFIDGENSRNPIHHVGSLSGNRGFANSDAKQLNGTDDVTLTYYIWEYLGNPVPCEIYGDCK